MNCPDPKNLQWISAWIVWWHGCQITAFTMYGFSIIWWARIGKTLSLVGGMAIILDIIGDDRIRLLGGRLKLMADYYLDDWLSENVDRGSGIDMPIAIVLAIIFYLFIFYFGLRFLVDSIDFYFGPFLERNQFTMLMILLVTMPIVIFISMFMFRTFAIMFIMTSFIFLIIQGLALYACLTIFGNTVLTIANIMRRNNAKKIFQVLSALFLLIGFSLDFLGS